MVLQARAEQVVVHYEGDGPVAAVFNHAPQHRSEIEAHALPHYKGAQVVLVGRINPGPVIILYVRVITGNRDGGKQAKGRDYPHSFHFFPVVQVSQPSFCTREGALVISA